MFKLPRYGIISGWTMSGLWEGSIKIRVMDEIIDKVVKEIFDEFDGVYVEGTSERIIKIILKQFETKVRLDQLEIDYKSHLKIIKD